MPNTPPPDGLSPGQALAYWKQVARTLHTMLGQMDSTTPQTECFDAMLADLRDAATAHLVAANALVGHYTMLAADQKQPGWATTEQAAPASYVPTSRQSAMPGYGQAMAQPRVPDAARAW